MLNFLDFLDIFLLLFFLLFRTNLEESRIVRPINRIDERKFTPRIEEYNDGTDSGVKVDDGTISEDDQGPPLPPRPPPRPRNVTTNESG